MSTKNNKTKSKNNLTLTRPFKVPKYKNLSKGLSSLHRQTSISLESGWENNLSSKDSKIIHLALIIKLTLIREQKTQRLTQWNNPWNADIWSKISQ